MDLELRSKTAVVTGASIGIGRAVAKALALEGVRVVAVARRKDLIEKLAREVQAEGGAAVIPLTQDIMQENAAKTLAAAATAELGHVDILINNAGAMFGSRQVAEGLERTFALNHVAYFVLAHVLRERLVASAPARVVNTASDAHRGARLDFDDLQSAAAYRGSVGEWLRHGGPGFKVYGRSKLCNILFTRELARRLTGTGVTANSLHPGFVATRFGDQSGGLISFGVRVAKRFALSPQQGAETLIYLASSREVAGVTGEYFHKCRPATPTREARDDASARRLWTATAALAHLED